MIHRALGAAEVVLNVGAGTGSYEPSDRRVIAVEPSFVMIAQRPSVAAPVVQAVAEKLPLRDSVFDVAMAVLAVHHFTDIALGLSETRRVAKRVVLLTFDRDSDLFWLTREYLPEVAQWDRKRLPSLQDCAEQLGGADEWIVPIPNDCIDGFYGAFWGRPEAYLDPIVHGGMSTFGLIDPATVKARLDRLADDLKSGAWDARHGELRKLDALDIGYRLLISPPRGRAIK
jgi:SAM-dependent methyltransferase